MTTEGSLRSTALRDGFWSAAPLLVGVVPFGLITGVAAAGSVIGAGLAWSTSFIIFAGAAQLATLDLFDAGAVSVVIIATGLIINSRHLMYSAALAPAFREFPASWRSLLPYILTDQAYAITITPYNDEPDPVYRRWFFLGGAASFWLTWQITTAVGAVFGAVIPGAWGFTFAIPLMFLALLIPTLRNRPALVAAIVGGGVAVLAASAPYRSGLIIGAVAGVVAGVAADRWWR